MKRKCNNIGRKAFSTSSSQPRSTIKKKSHQKSDYSVSELPSPRWLEGNLRTYDGHDEDEEKDMLSDLRRQRRIARKLNEAE